jgi:hypothetical protein
MYFLGYTSWHLMSGALWLLAAPAAPVEPQLVCDQVRLMNASGVIGAEHRYTFTAHCYRHASETHGSTTTNVVWHDYNVTGKGRWERKTGQASETLNFTGSATGTRFASGVCTQDPWLKNPPSGLGVCQSMAVQAKVASAVPTPLELIEPRVFLLARMVVLAEAQALSASHASGSAPPPPPEPTPLPIPRVNVGDQPAGGGSVVATQPVVVLPTQPVVVPAARTPVPTVVKLVFEGEDLVKRGKVQVNRGRIGAQLMSGFGPYWSGNAQLLWVDGTVGAVLDLIVDVAVAGRYSVALYPTKAPDYGNLKFEVDGRPSSFSLTGFQPKVMLPGSYPVGTFFLSPGPRRVRLMITGRSPKSTGYLVGIDRIVLTKIGS